MPVGRLISRVDDPRFLVYYRNCAEGYATVVQDFAFRRYPEAYFHTYDVLEFFWKALSILAKGGHPPTHLPNKSQFNTLMARFAPHIDAKAADRLKRVFERYNPTWTTGNPLGRAQARYGDGQRPPYALIREPAGRSAVGHSSLVASTLARIHREIRLGAGTLQIGLLNGRFSPSNPAEKVCNISPWGDFSPDPVGDWASFLAGISGAKLTRISILELSPRFQIVVNPFGEAYPDLPASRKILPGYTLIRSYISEGGVFVTAGGHPFSYYFDVTTGKKVEIFSPVGNVLHGRPSFAIGPGLATVSIPTTSVISDNLLNIDFDSETTWDARTVGATTMVPRREPADQKLSNFQLPGALSEFRAIDPRRSHAAVPVVRGRRTDGTEVYATASIPRQLGRLYHLGLNLSRGRVAEFQFACAAVGALCSNYTSYF